MKKLFLSLAVATFVFASCTKETKVSTPVGDSDAIGFDISTGKTRVSDSELSTLQNDVSGFGVYAQNKSGALITDRPYIYVDGEWKWAGSDADWQKWPQGSGAYPIDFYAFYPISATGGLATTGLSHEYVVDGNPSKQVDLLAARLQGVATRPATGEVALNFEHILSKLKFNFVIGAAMSVEIKSITLKGLGSTRNFNYAADDKMAWDGTAPTAVIDYPILSQKANPTTLTGDGVAAQPFAGDGAPLMLIPQNLSSIKWDPTSGAPSAANSYIEIVYRAYQTNGGANYIGFTNATAYPDYGTTGSEVTGPLYAKAGFPLADSLKMGIAYNYTIYLGTNNTTGGYLIEDNFVDQNGVATDLPYLDPTTGADKQPGQPLVTAGGVSFVVDEAAWESADVPSVAIEKHNYVFGAKGETKTFYVKVKQFSDTPQLSYSGTTGWYTATYANGALSIQVNANSSESTGNAESTITITADDGKNSASDAITISQLPMVRGVLAPPGVIGYIAGTNELTYKGSKEYTDTAIGEYAKQFGGLSTETVYVAYFKFGSLVAISSDPNDTDGSLEPVDIITGPQEWSGLEALKASPTWDGIPIQGKEHTLVDGDPVYSDPANGLGDPCAYYFNLKTPTGSPYNGETAYATGNMTWKAANALGTNTPVGYLSGRDGETGMFYPAAGYRNNSTGTVIYQGTYGYYWSSTAKDGSNGYNLRFANGSVSPSTNLNYAYGFAVRCIRP
jgi:hypothetical protein